MIRSSVGQPHRFGYWARVFVRRTNRRLHGRRIFARRGVRSRPRLNGVPTGRDFAILVLRIQTSAPRSPTLRLQARSPRLSARNLRKDEKLLFSGTSLKLTVRKAGDNPSRHNRFKAMFRAAFRSASSENPHDTHLNSCVRTPSDVAVFNLFSAEMLPHKGHACEV